MVIKFFAKDKVYLPEQKIKEYTVIDTIGEGKYGICYLVCKENKKYILKQLKTKVLRRSEQKAVYEEEVLARIEHDRIPKLLHKIKNDTLTGYVLEFMEGKTFEEIVFYDRHIFKRPEIYDIGMQLIAISRYLHQNQIVHRDIRPPNVIYKNKRVYLVDFGLARWVGHAYKRDVDFSYFGDFLLHLYYTSYEGGNGKSRPWYEELDLSQKELHLLQRLMGIKERYKDIQEVENDFFQMSQFERVP